MNQPFIHPLSDVQTTAIGSGTRLWQFVVALPRAQIGQDCNICSHCLIENDVILGDRVTVKSGVQLWDGLRVGNDVFIGPNASFANDRFPRSRQKPEKFLVTTIHDGASIGAGAVILPGLEIGRNAMVAAGAVITRTVRLSSLTPNTSTSSRSLAVILYSASCMLGSAPASTSLRAGASSTRGSRAGLAGALIVPFGVKRPTYQSNAK